MTLARWVMKCLQTYTKLREHQELQFNPGLQIRINFFIENEMNHENKILKHQMYMKGKITDF